MKTKKVGLILNKEKILFDLQICNYFGKIRGLMFRKKEKATALLFEFGKPTYLAIHSFFVFFPFYALWLDDKNKIIKIEKIKPFRFKIKPVNPFVKLIEVPINSRYSEIVRILDEHYKDLNIQKC